MTMVPPTRSHPSTGHSSQHLLSWNLKRIVPPRAGLIRPVRSSSCSGFLVNLSKEEVSVRRSLPGYSRKQIKEDNFPRTAGHD
jgi:hypothetical protein